MRVLLALLLVGCTVNVSEPEPEPTSDAGLRDGEMEAIVAQEHCYRWLCDGVDAGTVVHRSCGGLDAYACH